MSTRNRWAATALAAVTVAGTGADAAQHLGVVGGTAVAAQETFTLPAATDTELAVHLPLLPGWAPVPIGSAAREYPSDRGLLVDPALREREYIPSVIVTVDRIDDPAQSARQYAESLAHRIAQMSRTVEQSAGEVCGRPAFLMDFTGLGAGGDRRTQSGMGITVVPDGGRYAYIAILQGRNLDNPGYRKQRDALLSGFCVGG